MSSILKVDTIQDQNGNLIISKDSGGSGFLSPYASSSAPITYTVTVASKTSAHPYNGVGSTNVHLMLIWVIILLLHHPLLTQVSF